jgi:DNA-binding MarR family transcriptional regulator
MSNDLFAEFAAAMHLMRRAMGQNDPRRAVHHGQGRLLGVISEMQPTNQKDLVDRLDIRPSSLSELMGKLEQKGLISRQQDENDKRNYVVTLTAEGTRMAGQVAGQSKEFEEKLFGALTQEERGQLKILLEKLNAAWQEFAEEQCARRHPHAHPSFGMGGHGPHFPESRMRMRGFPCDRESGGW